MPSFREGRVASIVATRAGFQRVRLEDGAEAYALTHLVGELSPSDRLIVNTTAVELGLGTGGAHVVHLKLNDQAQRTVLCKDPFKAYDERVEKLIESL